MRTKRIIIFDLDGTLIEISKRYYKVYKEIILSLGGKVLPKKIYWNLKRKKTDFRQILLMSNVPADKEGLFLQKYIQEIEDLRNLKYDKVFKNTHQILQNLRKDYNPYLITLRRSTENTFNQLGNLGLKNMFSRVIIGDEESINKQSKKNLIKKLIRNRKAIIIGDSESELSVAADLKLPSVAVLSGIRNFEFLSKLKPNYIIKDVNMIHKVIKLIK